MCNVLEFFKNKSYQPVLTAEHTERIGTVVSLAKDNKVDLLWDLGGVKKPYYYFKQYGFNGVNLYNLLNVNTVNAAAAALSPTGAVTLTMSSIVALSWSGSIFFSTIENHIPHSFVKTKLVIRGSKYILGLPIQCVEWTSNQIFGVGENLIFGQPLPTNITEVYALNVGPKLENITKFKKPLLSWVINQLEKLNK